MKGNLNKQEGRTFVGNAFSLQMLKGEGLLSVRELSEKKFKKLSTSATSCVGHPDTAKVLGVEQNRINVSLEKGDILLVAQLQGGRLPEGATELPEGFSFKFLKMELL